jgi:hypothetical protein
MTVCDSAVGRAKKLLFIEDWDELEFQTACTEAIQIKIEYEKGFLGSLEQRKTAERHLALRVVAQ